ncbi:hypothetical protein Sango_1855500 [Sesamum angolense]|uniref:RanBP2-type domain-containing protein n=1 Tax=Sesamum angolense TaxID=2727404 RepID=A0AAE1WI88_9LAMI|nr:hypothetical protein Sango_1855500 [Sesamum angolense]
MAGGGGGKEGDWECSGCHNRNYAFRSFCNRCKQPRLLVDTKTPADSKWLPRIGDWICTGCTNNNYASREKCKKCGQPKEVAAMPAVAIPGASVPTHPTYFARAQGGGMMTLGALHPSMSLSSSWPLGGTDQYGNQPTGPYGLQPTSNWPPGSISDISYASQKAQLPPVSNGNGWRTGDWMCTCGFHNYSSRVQCKKCNAPQPISTSLVSPAVTDWRLCVLDLREDWLGLGKMALSGNEKFGDYRKCPNFGIDLGHRDELIPYDDEMEALGTKRLASEEFVHNWDNKRLNAGQAYALQQPYPGFESFPSPGGSQLNSLYPTIPTGNTAAPQTLQFNLQVPRAPATATLLGKGAKQWRDGDWMCSNCNNHNYASRAQCNRCKSQREVPAQPLSVA